jgi:hypothetical protein
MLPKPSRGRATIETDTTGPGHHRAPEEPATWLDIAAAEAWLREHLPPGEPIHITDEKVLDRAAAVITGRTRA